MAWYFAAFDDAGDAHDVRLLVWRSPLEPNGPHAAMYRLSAAGGLIEVDVVVAALPDLAFRRRGRSPFFSAPSDFRMQTWARYGVGNRGRYARWVRLAQRDEEWTLKANAYRLLLSLTHRHYADTSDDRRKLAMRLDRRLATLDGDLARLGFVSGRAAALGLWDEGAGHDTYGGGNVAGYVRQTLHVYLRELEDVVETEWDAGWKDALGVAMKFVTRVAELNAKAEELK